MPRSHPNGDAATLVGDRFKLADSIPPLALRPRHAAKALGISERLLWQLTHDGHIPCVRVGSGKRQTVLYPVADLRAWLSRQAADGERGKA
jgi:excisionase family DNA binding protein